MAATKKAQRNKVNKIKRINERRAEIERAVNNHELPKEFLDKFESAMRAAVHDNSLFTAKGNISHGKRALQDINTKALDALLKRETSGEARKKTYEHYKNYSEEQERVSRRKREFMDLFQEPEKIPFTGETYTPPEPTQDTGYTYEDYLGDRDFVYEYMEEEADWYEAMKAAFQGVGGKKSYAELRQAYEKWDQSTNEEKQAMYQAAVNREQAAYFS